MKFRKKPVEVDAVQWTGTNAFEIDDFTGSLFDVLTPRDRADCDDAEATARVFDILHSTWVLVRDGDWIIRGLQGEFYPCRSEVFEATYEAVAA
jgi:hypothetical protein